MFSACCLASFSLRAQTIRTCRVRNSSRKKKLIRNVFVLSIITVSLSVSIKRLGFKFYSIFFYCTVLRLAISALHCAWKCEQVVILKSQCNILVLASSNRKLLFIVSLSVSIRRLGIGFYSKFFIHRQKGFDSPFSALSSQDQKTDRKVPNM